MEKKTDLKLSTWKRIRPLAAVTANFSSLFCVDEMIINKPSRFQQLEQIFTLKGNFFYDISINVEWNVCSRVPRKIESSNV